MTAPRLMLLDTPSLYFRAFYGVPESITAPDGMPVNAVRGLIDFVARLVADHHPTRLVSCMDYDWRPAFRVDALPAYKAHRVADDGGDQTPDTLGPQVPVIEAVFDAVGIPSIGADGFEADDVIGTLATDPGCAVDVVTGDRDLFQLVDDSVPVRVIYTARGVGKADVVDETWVQRKYDIPGTAYAEFALLRGDPSDGLPGVPGVGEKTAAALVRKHGTVEALLASGDAPGKVTAAVGYLASAAPVVRVVRDVPLPAYDDALPARPRHPDRLVELAARYGLDSPLNRLLTALQAAAA